MRRNPLPTLRTLISACVTYVRAIRWYQCEELGGRADGRVRLRSPDCDGRSPSQSRRRKRISIESVRCDLEPVKRLWPIY